MSEALEPTSRILLLRQRAYLLHQVASAPKGKLTQALAMKIPKPIQEELSLSWPVAEELRTALIAEGMLSKHSHRSVSYSLTDAGQLWLREHQTLIPLAPAKGKFNPPADRTIQEAREAWVLLQLLAHPDGATASVLNKKPGPKKLELNSGTVRQIRSGLAILHQITVTRTGRSERYSLTPKGKQYLVTLSFDAFGELKLKGSALTELLTVARNAVPTSTPAATIPLSTSTSRTPTSTELEAAVMEIFHDLLRERFANIRMVPIHEIRAAVANRFGSQSASESVFNPLLLELRRAKKIQLVSIDDRSRATPEQLRNSIYAVGETFFYVEKAHVANPIG